jgi:Grx4 family monothiol glutaredoxin
MVIVITEASKLQEILDAKKPTVLHFGASWCAPSETVNKCLDASPVEAIKVYIDAEKFPEAAEKFDIEAVPTVLFLRESSLPTENNVVASVEGGKISTIEFNLRSLYGFQPKSAFKTLDEYLKYLIERDTITLFITGTVSQPRCGFTEKLVKILHNDLGLADKYTFYDILTDEEVCQGLKKYSDWATYPQIYTNGELVGGLDICTQLHSKGQLAPTLGVEVEQKKKATSEDAAPVVDDEKKTVN